MTKQKAKEAKLKENRITATHNIGKENYNIWVISINCKSMLNYGAFSTHFDLF